MVNGYLWDTYEDTIAPEILMTDKTSLTGQLNNGMSHYFHVRTLSCAGVGSETVHIGPFYVNNHMFKGDVNYDLKTNIKDAIILMQLGCGINPGNNYVNIGADINNDKKLNILDVIYILKKCAN